MVACISPAVSNFDESLSTLRYADKVKSIKNKPTVNKNIELNEISSLKQYITVLEERVEALQSNKVSNGELIQAQLLIATLEKKLQGSLLSDEMLQLARQIKSVSQVLIDTNDEFDFEDFKSKLCHLVQLLNQYLDENGKQFMLLLLLIFKIEQSKKKNNYKVQILFKR